MSLTNFLKVFQTSFVSEIPFLVGSHSPSFSKYSLILTIVFPLKLLIDTLLFLVRLQNYSPLLVFSLTGLSYKASTSSESRSSSDDEADCFFLGFS